MLAGVNANVWWKGVAADYRVVEPEDKLLVKVDTVILPRGLGDFEDDFDVLGEVFDGQMFVAGEATAESFPFPLELLNEDLHSVTFVRIQQIRLCCVREPAFPGCIDKVWLALSLNVSVPPRYLALIDRERGEGLKNERFFVGWAAPFY